MRQYPFLLGTTSYIYPADILTNTVKLAGMIDDIEIVLFAADNDDNIPSPPDLKKIKKIGKENNTGFTIHLPLDLSLGDSDEDTRMQSVHLASHIINLTDSLHPWAYIIHLNRSITSKNSADSDLTKWENACCMSIEQIIAGTGKKESLCIENLEGYPILHLAPVLDRLHISLCLDIGHLWVQKKDPVYLIEQFFNYIRVVHLHGISKRDHKSLIHIDFTEVRRVLDILAVHNFSGVLTLELFDADDLSTSLKVIQKWAKGYVNYEKKI